MSRLARALMLAATLAATTLAGLTAAAQAHPASDDAARRQALAQERYYSTWRAGDPTAAAPAPPSRQPAWLVPAIGALAAALALLGIRATMITRRRRGRVRVRQPA